PQGLVPAVVTVEAAEGEDGQLNDNVHAGDGDEHRDELAVRGAPADPVEDQEHAAADEHDVDGERPDRKCSAEEPYEGPLHPAVEVPALHEAVTCRLEHYGAERGTRQYQGSEAEFGPVPSTHGATQCQPHRAQG